MDHMQTSAYCDGLAAEILVVAIENGLFSTGTPEEKREVAAQVADWYSTILGGVVAATGYETIEEATHDHHGGHHHEHPHEDSEQGHGRPHGKCRGHHNH